MICVIGGEDPESTWILSVIQLHFLVSCIFVHTKNARETAWQDVNHMNRILSQNDLATKLTLMEIEKGEENKRQCNTGHCKAGQLDQLFDALVLHVSDVS